MTVNTSAGIPVNGLLVENYFRNLVNQFFKILPLWENGEASLATYIASLRCEMLGCGGVIEAIHDDPQFLSLVSILQYFLDHPDLEPLVVRREVFRAISVCNKIRARYADGSGVRAK